jgi:hypothetical protein
MGSQVRVLYRPLCKNGIAAGLEVNLPMKLIRMVFCILVIFSLSPKASALSTNPVVTGELKKWHKVTLTFYGPQSSETAEPNPFLDYRFSVTFKNDNRIYKVPGYFAADGNAANTGATSGNNWRVHFAPDFTGQWTYSVSFRTGKNIAVSDKPNVGEPIAAIDGITGKFTVIDTDKCLPDNRARGRLEYVNERYLQFAETKDYFIKQGADAPENFLAYTDFDGDFKADGQNDRFIKTWYAHIKDWQDCDPTWRDGKGRGIIGAVNYLAEKGMNAISFLTLNIDGDDRNVFPYLNYNERYRMDVSRLDQWEIVFSHMDKKGIYLHFKTQETENEILLDNGELGIQRRLYYRELIARFGHHLALNWNLGEENGWPPGKLNQSATQRKAMAEYFYRHDPYHHLIVIHNGMMPDDLLGNLSKLTGFSLQTNREDFLEIHKVVLEWINKSADTGKAWVVACDEPGDASHALVPDSDDPNHDNARKNALWGTLMAGGTGNEWYFGYKHDNSDLTCQDWRSRNLWWDQCRIAMQFFNMYLPFWKMQSHDELISTKDGYCFAQPGHIYAVYLKNGGTAEIDLQQYKGFFSVRWFNPLKGGQLTKGTIETISGPSSKSIGHPPAKKNKDWLCLITEQGNKSNH